MANGVLSLIEVRIALIGLVCLAAGVALSVYTMRLWREARPESPALAPLEVMSDDEFVNGDDQTRRELMQMARTIAEASAAPVTTPRDQRSPRRPSSRRAELAPERFENASRAPIDPLLK